MKTVFLCLVMCLTVSATVSAQRKIVVVDLETLLPVRDVTVRTDNTPAVITNYLGEANIRQAFDSISFKHVEYLPERLAFTELEDTMFLVPLRYSVGEVVVMGIGSDLRRQLERVHENQIYTKPVSGFSFNFGLMIDRRTRRDRKHLLKAREILRQFDRKN